MKNTSGCQEDLRLSDTIPQFALKIVKLEITRPQDLCTLD